MNISIVEIDLLLCRIDDIWLSPIRVSLMYSDVLRGIGGIYLMFQVVRGSGGTQPDGGNVLLRVILEFLNPLVL